MKPILAFISTVLLLAGCEKQALDTGRLLGSWSIKNTRPLTAAGSVSPEFNQGSFFFKEDYSFRFTTIDGTYEGKWSLNGRQQSAGCYTAQDGSQVCSDEWNEILQLDAHHTTTQKTKSATLQMLSFPDNDQFTAILYSSTGIAAYEYHFERLP